MSDVFQPMLFAALLWWFSTGAILWLIGLPRRTFKWTALSATALLIGATILLLALRQETGRWAAYAGFATGMALWAWHEVMFLLGYISGPTRKPCPPDLATWPRFVASAKALIHHELAIAIHAVFIIVVSLQATNTVAAWTFLLLWGMRLSTKLIVFFGAPNISDEFLPAHLSYLKSYFQKRAQSRVAPLAILLATLAAASIIYAAISAPAGGYASLGLIMVATLAGLAILEHWALILPLPGFQADAHLWKWAQRPQQTISTKPVSSEWRR